MAVALAVSRLAWSEEPPPPAPRITAMVPLAVPQGFSGTVRLRGMRLKDATAVRVEGPVQPHKIEIKEKKEAPVPAGIEAAVAGDSEITVELVLPSDAPAGPLSLVVAVGDTAAAPLTLKVCPAGSLATIGDPGTGFASAPSVVPGQVVPGTITGPREVDVYAVAAVAGQRLRITVMARRAASLLDPLLSVYDRNGRQLAMQDDTGVEDRDASLDLSPVSDGPLYLVVQDALDLGSEWHPYLLEVAAAP